MSFISQYCTVNPDRMNVFMNAPRDTALYELRRLSQELYAAFGLQIVGLANENALRPSAHLVTSEGVTCGACSATREGVENGKYVFRYFVTLPTIRKDKASANSDKDSRDSVNISALIRAIKKGKEEPTTAKVAEALNDGMKYTMRAVANINRGHPRLSFDNDTTAAMTRFILGVDSALPNMYISTLKEKFDTYQSEMKSYANANADYHRYARGVTLVCIDTTNSSLKPHYLVCDAVFNHGNEKFEIQGSLKRYNSLTDSPLAPMAVMIKTHMQGTTSYDAGNDLGVMRQDKYFPEIDIAVGYAKHQQLWVAIPKSDQ